MASKKNIILLFGRFILFSCKEIELTSTYIRRERGSVYLICVKSVSCQRIKSHFIRCKLAPNSFSSCHCCCCCVFAAQHEKRCLFVQGRRSIGGSVLFHSSISLFWLESRFAMNSASFEQAREATPLMWHGMASVLEHRYSMHKSTFTCTRTEEASILGLLPKKEGIFFLPNRSQRRECTSCLHFPEFGQKLLVKYCTRVFGF